MKLSRVLSVVMAWGSLNTTPVFAETVYTVLGKQTTRQEFEKKEASAIYELKKREVDMIENAAKQAYLEAHWDREAKLKKVTPDQAAKNFVTVNSKVDEKDVNAFWNQHKSNPQLAKLKPEEQKQKIREYLQSQKASEAIEGLLSSAVAKKELVINVTPPEEPVYSLVVTNKDHVRYGPSTTDTTPKAKGCEGDKCPITIVEYSEYQCPFCSRITPESKRLLTEYQGQIRWIVRDFPLSFHDRARPAAIAAKCASAQGKYWEMYSMLFENQSKLGDADLESYGKKLVGDFAKYKQCLKDPGELGARIDENMKSGMAAGVSGTPAFFINGRRQSGALGYSDFKSIIEKDLKKNKA